MQILLSGVHSAAISRGEKFSLLCEGRTDTDLMDISGGAGRGGAGEAQFGRMTAPGPLRVFVCELSGLTGGHALYKVPQGMFSIVIAGDKAKLKL